MDEERGENGLPYRGNKALTLQPSPMTPRNLDTRRHRRFRVPLLMRFALVSGEDERRISRFYRIKIRDISLGGVSILSPVLKLDGIHFFYNTIPQVRNRMIMQIYLPKKEPPVTALGYAAQGRIVRVGGKKAFLIGIHFLQINEEQGERLRAFLQGLEEGP